MSIVLIEEISEKYKDLVAQSAEECPGGAINLFNWGVADMVISFFDAKEECREIIRLLSKEPINAVSVSTYEYYKH